MVKPSPSNAGGVGAKIPTCLMAKEPKHKQYYNRFNKDFKTVHIKNKKMYIPYLTEEKQIHRTQRAKQWLSVEREGCRGNVGFGS